MELLTNNQIDLAYNFLKNTGANLFLTGRAGTGKTTFLRNAIETLNKRAVVAAPTGVAALNARGVTLHSLFQLPFGPYIPGVNVEVATKKSAKGFSYNKMGKNKITLIRSIELLVIDEISMVRSDVLDAVDDVLKRVRRDTRPFGGVQLLMIGDIQQLSPICRDEDWQLLKQHYSSPYFFDSNALKQCSYITVELTQIFRQRDPHFTSLLNAIRENNISAEVIEELNKRYIPNFSPSSEEGYITLTTHNHSANSINSSKLAALDAPSCYYKATVNGDYPEMLFPNDLKLELKVGAQVIFIKNDQSPEKLYYNGMIGEIVELTDSGATVLPLSGDEEISVVAVEWENIEYTLDPTSGELKESVKGSFRQLPLKCAWAITIHKSQGLSFDRAIIDAAGSFAHGQVYVALSRCRSLEGLVLTSPIRRSSIIKDGDVAQFNEYVLNNQPTESILERYKKIFYYEVLCEIFTFENLKIKSFSISKLLNINLYRVYPSLCDKLKERSELFDKEVFTVGVNFKNQLKRLIGDSEDYRTDKELKERLKRAATYFKEQIAPYREVVDELFSITADAKDVKKRLEELRVEINEDLLIKELALEMLLENFDIQEYQKGKIKIITEKKANKKVKNSFATKSVTSSLPKEIIHEELYSELINWRREEADAIGKPAFYVLPNRAIIEIQATLPTSIKELKLISGVGDVKLGTYGDQIVDIVVEFCHSNNIDPTNNEFKLFQFDSSILEEEQLSKRSKKEPKPKIPTHNITLSLILEGKDIPTIASLRELKESTIYDHISKLIIDEKIDIDKFISKKRLEMIQKAILNRGDKSLKDLKDSLGIYVSYDEIKLVMGEIKRLEKRGSIA